MFFKLTKFLVSLSDDISGSAVGSNSFAFRKMLLDIVQNNQQFVVGQTQGIAVTKEDSLNPVVVTSSPCQILQHFFRFSDLKLLCLVHVTECTLVMRAAYGHLHQQTVSFAWGSVYIANISHIRSPFSSCNLRGSEGVLHSFRGFHSQQSKTVLYSCLS